MRPALRIALPTALACAGCLHGEARPVAAGAPFELGAVVVHAPPEDRWTVEEGGAGEVAWLRFRRPPLPPAYAQEALASRVPLPVRPGSPADLLDLVRAEQREARGPVEERGLELVGGEARLDDRFGPLTVVTAGRGQAPGAPRGSQVVLFREYTFVLPERPGHRYRVAYLELAPEWTPGTGYEERARAFFSGVERRSGDVGPEVREGKQGAAAGPALARLRGVEIAGLLVQTGARELLPARAGPGGVGLELGLDLFAGRSASERRGAFSLAASGLLVRSFGTPWLGAGLQLGYATLTRLDSSERTDGVDAGLQLAAGLDHRVSWGTLSARLDLLAGAPRYARAGLLVGLRL